MHINAYQKILLAYVTVLLVFWIGLSYSQQTDGFWNYFYSFAFSLVPLLAGLAGCFIAKQWGWFKSAIGKAVFFTSLGSFAWGAGSMVWSYYNFFMDVAAPYPGIADIGFVLALPFWVIGTISLSRATGAKFGLRKQKGKLVLFIAPVVIIVFSYYFLVVLARGGFISAYDDAIKTFFDLAYPIGDIVILSIALLVFGLSVDYLGGFYRRSILAILIGFATMYVADFIFSYTTTLGTFYNGNFGDLMFMFALSFISYGVLGFTYAKEKSVSSGVSQLPQIITRIIKEQEVIIGPLAWREAANVVGLDLNQSGAAAFVVNQKVVVDELIGRYERLFGRASIEVCKEAVQDLIAEMPAEEIPSSLK